MNSLTQSKMAFKSLVPDSARVRTSWSIIVVKRNGKYEIHVIWKNVRGQIDLFSPDSTGVKFKSNFGAIKEVRYKEKDGELYFVIYNRQGSKKGFATKNLELNLWKTCEFTQKLMEIRSQGSDEILAQHLNVLVNTKDFGQISQSKDTYCSEGFAKSLDQVDGDSKLLLNLAKNDAAEIDRLSLVKDLFSGGAKSQTQDNVPTNKRTKLTKSQEEDKLRKQEISSEEGLEKKIMESYSGRKEILLDNLMLAPVLEAENPVSEARVSHLATGFSETWDPSQMILTVVPTEPDNYSEKNDNTDTKYYVVHGRHRLAALKKLDEGIGLSGFVTLEHRKILCIVLHTSSSIVQSYAQHRGQKVQANVQMSSVENLVGVINSLRDRLDEEKTSATIKSMAILLNYKSEHVTVLKKISHWTKENIFLLSETLKRYQKYQTKDVVEEKGRGYKKKMSAGQSKQLPKTLFAKLGKIEDNQVKDLCESVMNDELSLKQAIETCLLNNKRELTKQIMATVLNTSVHNLMLEFKDKLSEDILDSFEGADVDKPNERGRDLLNYCDALKCKVENNEPRVNVHLWNERSAKMKPIDILVLTCNTNEENINYALNIINQKIKPNNPYFSSIIILNESGGNLEELTKVMKKASGVDTQVLYFKREQQNGIPVKGGLRQNAFVGWLSGNVKSQPIDLINGSIKTNLKKVISRLAPPQAKIAMINLSDKIPVALVHSPDTKKVDYFVTSVNDLNKLKELLKVESYDERYEERRNEEEEEGEDILNAAGDNIKSTDENEKNECNKEGSQENLEGNFVDEEEIMNDSLLSNSQSSSQKLKTNQPEPSDVLHILQIEKKKMKKARKGGFQINNFLKTVNNLSAMAKRQQFKTTSPIKSEVPEDISSNEEDSDTDLQEDCEEGDKIIDLDEILKLPSKEVILQEQMLDEFDKRILSNTKADEDHYHKLEESHEKIKKMASDRKDRMRENKKRRTVLEESLTEEKLRTKFKESVPYIEGVWNGTIPSKRFEAFNNSHQSRHKLYYTMITSPFTNQQLKITLEEFDNKWMKTHEEKRKLDEFVWKVLMPEFFLKIYMEMFQVNKTDAEAMIFETPLHRRDTLRDMGDMETTDLEESSESD